MIAATVGRRRGSFVAWCGVVWRSWRRRGARSCVTAIARGARSFVGTDPVDA